MKRLPLLIILMLALAGCVGGLPGCRPTPPPPPTPTFPPAPTITPSRTATATATVIASPTNQATATRPPVSVTPTPDFATATLVVPILTPTPVLLGHHQVVRGDTMHDIGLLWYQGRRFDTSAAIWGPICQANPEVENCRMIFVGDVLRIPALP